MVTNQCLICGLKSIKMEVDDTNTTKIFFAWKATSLGEPIEGTDRMFRGISKRSVIKHLAYEEGVDWKHNDMIVRLPNGDNWCVTQF